jgi:hypothetical protein
VFVRFRGRRLTAARGLSLQQALRFAARMRAERFHDRDHVMVVDERSGEMVDDGVADGAEGPCAPTDAAANGGATTQEGVDLEETIRAAREAVMTLAQAVEQFEVALRVRNTAELTSLPRQRGD